MRWFLDLPTRAKLYLSFGLMVALLALVAVAAYRSIALMQASQRTLYEHEFTDVRDIKEIRANQIANRADMLSLMVPGTRAELPAMQEAIGVRTKTTDELMRRLIERNRADTESLKRLQELASLRRSSLQTRERETLPLIRAGRLEEARQLHLGVQAERDVQMEAIADAFVAYTEQAVEAALRRSAQVANDSLRVFLLAGSIALLLAVAMSLLLNRLLAKPLEKLAAAAERVAAGDLSVDVPADGRADETGTLLDTFARMLASLRQSTRELSAEKRLLHNLMDSVPDAIFFKDREHRFLRINRVHASKILGVTHPEDAVGRPTSDFFPPGEARQRDAEDEEILRTGRTLPDKVRRISLPGGKVRWSSTTKAPVRDESGQVTGLVGIARDVTERQRLQEQLAEREAGLRRAQLMAKLAHVITRSDGSFESWSETLPQLVGMDLEGMPKSTREWLKIVHPDDKERFRSLAIEAGATSGRLELEYRLRRADGTWIDMRQVSEPMHGDSAGPTRWFGTLQDVTEQKQAQQRISRLNRVHAVLSGINGLIVRVRDREELYREACRIAVQAGGFSLAWIGSVDRQAMKVAPVAFEGPAQGYLEHMPLDLDAGREEGRGLAGHAVRERRPMIANDIENDARVLLRKEAVHRGFRSLVILPLVVSDEVAGLLALYAESPGFFDDEEMRLLVELAGDISFALQHIEQEEKLDYLAYYDSITGLANRTLFRERLEQHLREAGRMRRQLAVIIVDVDRFRTVNDTFGRHAGDALLKEMAVRFRQVGGDEMLLARLGADHFALMIPHVRQAQDLVRLIEAARSRILAEPFPIDGTELRVATKAGIAIFPDDGADADILLRNAEAALRRAKASGERHVFYAAEMTERVAETLSLENKLRQALEKDEFVLHYQPKVELEDRKIVGVEALIRWRSPELGLVPPGKFIPLLEETGLILEVGSWALRRAALDHRAWSEMGIRPPRVAVNVSPIQLRQRDFVETVERAVMEGVAPVGIDLEITESLIMEDVEATIEKLKKAQALGIRIAIDDFGTGYSSLAYLAKLPVGTLKIDRSFVITMLKDLDTATLVQTVITLAHSLKRTVVAEGVDSEEQARFLRLLRCDQMQGYLFSKPLPVEQLVELLRRNP